jgi:hypothetical protein
LLHTPCGSILSLWLEPILFLWKHIPILLEARFVSMIHDTS